MFLRASNPAIGTHTPTLSRAQLQLDGLTQSISNQAGAAQTIAAMSMGSLFYQMGRVGTLTLASQSSRLAPLLNLASYGIGLGAETVAFETSHRALEALAGNHANTNLWNWNGSGGLREGFTSTLFTIGSLKAFGKITQGQHFLLQHLSSDLGMVGSQNALGLLGWAPRPQGNFLEQLAHAEATRMQLSVSSAITHTLTPRLQNFERSLELSNRINETSARTPVEHTTPLLEMAANRKKPGNPDDSEGRTVLDAFIPERMRETAEAEWARNFEQAYWRGGIEYATEEIIKFLRYKHRTQPMSDVENALNALVNDNIIINLLSVLVKRGVPLDQIYPPQPQTPIIPDGTENHARVFDMSQLGLVVGNTPSESSDGSTQAVSSTGIMKMLGGGAPANNVLATVPAPTVVSPPIGRLARMYNATLGRLFRSTATTSPSSVIAPAPRIRMNGPFVFYPASGIYNYRFPQGALPRTIGRGWFADDKITGDDRLSRKHITIVRKIGPEGTFYEITAHALVVIDPKEGGQKIVDHNQKFWLQSGDIVRLTPDISFIFDPVE